MMLSLLRGLCAREEASRLRSIDQLGTLLKDRPAKGIRSLLLKHLIRDPHPVVRLKVLVVISENFATLVNGSETVEHLLGELCSLLENDLQPAVRIAAAFLLGKCEAYFGPERIRPPNRLVANAATAQLLVSEAVFIALGIAIGDVLEEVRELACKLLADISVSEAISCQLLSKAADAQEIASGAGSRFSLPWCFRGNFILALEDEYKRVRLAAVRAAREHAMRSVVFAGRALEFFVDSFQDEASIVRVAALEAATQVLGKSQIECSQAHLEAILAHLDDAEEDSRASTRAAIAMLSGLHEGELVLKIARCFPLAIQKFPGEAAAHYEALCSMGGRNASLVGELVPRLLKTDKFFLIPEPNVEDVTYNVRLALVLGALNELPDLLAALPPFVPRHYHYLSIRYPGALPSFRDGHALEDTFWKVSTIATAPEVVEEAQKSLVHQLARIAQDQDPEMVRVVVENLECNAYGFSRPLLALLQRIVEMMVTNAATKGTKVSSKTVAAAILLPFEGASEEVVRFVKQICAQAKSTTARKGSSETLIPKGAAVQALVQLRATIGNLDWSRTLQMVRGRDLRLDFSVGMNQWTEKAVLVLLKHEGSEVAQTVLRQRSSDCEFSGQLHVPDGAPLPKGGQVIQLEMVVAVAARDHNVQCLISERYTLRITRCE